MCNTWCSSSGVERRVVEVVEGICKGGMQPAVRVMRFRRAGGCELEPEPELELSSVNVTEGELSSLNVTEGERFTPDSLRLTASLTARSFWARPPSPPASQGKLKTLGSKQ